MPGTDQNTKIIIYLRTLYTVTGGDLTTLTQRYLKAATQNDANKRMKALQAAAA